MKPILYLKDFDALVAEFLLTLDNGGREEYYDTDQKIAAEVLGKLRHHLFSEEINKDIRRAQYLVLKAEFEEENK